MKEINIRDLACVIGEEAIDKFVESLDNEDGSPNEEANNEVSEESDDE